MPPRIFISAGEPSGDLHAGYVAAALRDRLSGVTLEAFGGPQLAAAGARVRFPASRYTVLGFAEILGKLPAHARLLRRLEREFRAGRYDLVLPVDYPGFNLRLAEAARRHGVPVLYYIPPKVWAARPSPRFLPRFRRAVDRVACIFPFEAEFFSRAGIPAEFVGHPLLDGPAPPGRADARCRLGIGMTERVLSLLPGSRSQEISRLWQPFREAALRLLDRGLCDRVLVATLPGLEYPESGTFDLLPAQPEAVLAAADAALVKSGTATLEAALAGTPMVVAYRVHPLTAWLARRVMLVPWVSLANLLAGQAVVPEVLQAQVTADRLASEAARLLAPGSPRAAGQRAAFPAIRERLGSPGASDRVAAMAEELLRQAGEPPSRRPLKARFH